MPFPFALPTTSAFSFSSCLISDSHPSLPLAASSRRGVVRATLKQHKRLPPASQTTHLTTVAAALDSYLPYLLAIADAVAGASSGSGVLAELRSPPRIQWRPTVSDSGATPLVRRISIDSLGLEAIFALAARATVHSLQARAAIRPLLDPSTGYPDDKSRTAAVVSAKTHLLAAAAIYDHLERRAIQVESSPCCPDVAPSTLRALSILALAESTALVVLKDDPYPAVVAQERNKNDREWMYKAPSIPKVRAHLLARLCLAAAEHAATASSLLQQPTPGLKVCDALIRYVEDLRRACHAKACRFFGIDADLGGQTGTAIAWLRAGLEGLGEGEAGRAASSNLGLTKLKKEWSERREDRRIERQGMWGVDAGRAEEARVLQMLENKWTNINDTVMAQPIPPIGPLLAQMPLGRDIHKIPEFRPPTLDLADLDALSRPLPDRTGDEAEDPDFPGAADSSDGESPDVAIGAVPGAFSPAEGSGRTFF